MKTKAFSSLGASRKSKTESRGHKPRAFTIIELLVAIAIVSILIALMLPAVQMAREAARRTSCANHLRQVGVALHQHHEVHNYFPSNGGEDEQQTIPAASGGKVSIYTRGLTGATLYWGVGDPALNPKEQAGSWAFSILPYLDSAAIYDQRKWTVSVETYICPSRRAAKAVPVVASDAHGDYEGGGWNWGKTDYAANGLIFHNRPRLMRIANLSDGTSNTILIGEKAFDPEKQLPETWYWDEPFFTGGSSGTRRRGLEVLRDGPGILVGGDGGGNWGAAHPGGAHFLFSDGSVRMIQHGESWMLMEKWLTPADGISDNFSSSGS